MTITPDHLLAELRRVDSRALVEMLTKAIAFCQLLSVV
jgi:hypothetical protein